MPAIAEYKLKYPEVNLEVTHFETYDDRYKKLATEIMSGRGPDILLINSMTFPDPEKSMKAGVFADLTPFHTADKSYNTDDYYQPVLQAGFSDKEQYIFPLSFTFSAIAGDKALLAKHNMNLSENMTAYDMLEEVARYIESGGEIPVLPDQMIDGHFNPFNMVDVDDDSLNDPAFKAFMEHYKTLYLTGSLTYKPNAFIAESVRIFEPLGTKYIMCNGDLWNSNFDPIYKLLSAVLANGGEPFLYPMYNGDGKLNGQICLSIAINSSSENKQNAYNFIKLARDLSGSDAVQEYRGFSTKRADLQGLYNNSEENVAFISEYTGIDMKPLGEAGFDRLNDILDKVDRCSYANGINTYLFDQFLPYFKGEISLDSCIAEAKNWMDIYISE